MNRKLLLELADKYGTPLYVYDGDLVVKRYKELYEYIQWDKLKILYAMKANYNIGILKLLKMNDAYLDAVSPAEVLLALKLGFAKKRILFTANNTTLNEMKAVEETGVLFNIGSLSELEKYGKTFPGSKVCVRFNPDVYAGENKNVRTAGKITKFGILLSEVNHVQKIANKYELKIVGIHEHTGSGIAQTTRFYKSMTNILSIVNRKRFPDLEFIDFGGGFKVSYHPESHTIDYHAFGKKIGKIFSDFCKKFGGELYMYFEPGKYVVAESGFLLVEVNTIKNNRGRLIAGTNSGFNQLIRPVLYDAYHHIENLDNPDGKYKTYDICGNICETKDCFAEQREIPQIKEGDKLAIRNAGAYCYSMGSIYNLRPMPSEVLIIDGKEYLTTKQISNEDLAGKLISSASAEF